ncbi:MaoC family dehydratase [Nakamurella leprariae]|uniref:MaoC family dehydratase n=1 Tax=Nakamurella leprariae TaxID=2803911 RepID=A0A939BY45_9ACTN|nr:MaoC family dehydratase [Nakamurella leprariae]MBM9466226.1 MaoC family dehydratase [Nakamurella leprariae]
MTGTPQFGTVAVGDQLPALTVRITRAQLVRYAGASGDFNPIHWSRRVAQQVGLPDVIAHGMLTMAQAGRIVSDWAGGPAAVRSLESRFTRPVVVPDDEDGVELELTAVIAAVDEQARTVRVDVTARSGGQTVLSRCRAVVALD